jgi:hypothetical protein
MVCAAGTTGHDPQDSRAGHSESGLARRACHARRARRELVRLANLFSILLMLQFVSHSAQQIRHAEGFPEGLPCSEEFRDIQDILFSSCA